MERKFRNRLLELCEAKGKSDLEEMLQLKCKLLDESYALEKICTDLGEEKMNRKLDLKIPPMRRIMAVNAPVHTEFKVNGSEYVLGKNPLAVDGVIDYSKAISRVHCKINMHGKQYKIIDLHSKNGTYVNGVRLKPEQEHLLNDNDIIRLADSEFKIIYE